MKFQISPTNSERYFLDETRLLEILFKASIDKEKEDERKKLNHLASKLAQELSKTKSIINSKLLDIIIISFNTGYYFGKFISKNNVLIIEEKEENEYL